MKVLCQDLKIPTTSILSYKPDWGFDGADKVNKQNWLIKGRGAAMLKEKLNIANARITYILVDNSKIVNEFENNNNDLNIPIEVIPEAVNSAKEAIEDLGAIQAILRKAEKKDGPVITESGNVILDTKFVEIYDGLEEDIKSIVDDSSIILKKYEPNCVFCGSTDDLIEYKGKLVCKKCSKELN